MTEYDYSPEAYERHMATQTRISNWADKVSQSIQMPSQAIPPYSSDHQQHRPRPTYSQQHTHSQTHSRSNSNSRSHSRERPPYHREQYRPRSHSHSSSRPHAPRSYTQPIHSRTYSYALHQPPPPVPIPVPQPGPFLHQAPRRSQTLPPQPHHVVYHHTYDAPRGGPTYVIGPQIVGGVPPQIRMQNAVRIPHSFFLIRMAWC